MTLNLKVYTIFEKNVEPHPHSVVLENGERRLLFESGIITELFEEEFSQVKECYKKVIDAHGCLGVLQLLTDGEPAHYLMLIEKCSMVGRIGCTVVYRVEFVTAVALQNEPREPACLLEVRKFLNSGYFYFTRERSSLADIDENDLSASDYFHHLDITLCAQRRFKTDRTDNRFFWNRRLHIPFVRFGINAALWLEKIMCGSVEIKSVKVEREQIHLVLISRYSSERAGSRGKTIGVNDNGYVANSVETEQAVYIEGTVVSYVQTRGTVPLFWEQTTNIPFGSEKVQLTRGFEVTQHAFAKHFRLLQQRYGKVAILNLLCHEPKDNSDAESFLSNEYVRHFRAADFKEQVPFIIYDFQKEACGRKMPESMAKLKMELESQVKLTTIFLYHEGVHQEQCAVIRTNCMDCLERTNRIQMFIGLMLLPRQLTALTQYYAIDTKLHPKVLDKFRVSFRQMWTRNGGELARIYTGGGGHAPNGKFRSRGQSSAMEVARQSAIEVILRSTTLKPALMARATTLLPISMVPAAPTIVRMLCSRYGEYTKPKKLQIGVGTYNAAGNDMYKNYRDDGPRMWLLPGLPATNPAHRVCDLYAIGFQEIVELGPGVLLGADDDNVRGWCKEIERILSGQEKFSLVSYCQLVGICLFLFVKKRYTQYVRDVACDYVKLGLKGTTGNKGAVAIRFVFSETSLCFICAHLTHGQLAVNERNADYHTIMDSLNFPMAKNVNSHDYVFFLGDLNYRIDIDNDYVRSLIRRRAFATLLRADQLQNEMKSGAVFEGFQEGALKFPPTYKYDKRSSLYDSAEKAPRTPAWTDRVLWRYNPVEHTLNDAVDGAPPGAVKEQHSGAGFSGECFYYGRGEMNQSDHRPVFAILQVEVRKTSAKHLSRVYSETVMKHGPADATVELVITTKRKRMPSISNPAFVKKVIAELNTIGQVIIVRFYKETMWATFRNPEYAVVAANAHQLTVDGLVLRVGMKSKNWVELAHDELEICSDNTVPLYTRPIISVLTARQAAAARNPALKVRKRKSYTRKRGVARQITTAPPADDKKTSIWMRVRNAF